MALSVLRKVKGVDFEQLFKVRSESRAQYDVLPNHNITVDVYNTLCFLGAKREALCGSFDTVTIYSRHDESVMRDIHGMQAVKCGGVSGHKMKDDDGNIWIATTSGDVLKLPVDHLPQQQAHCPLFLTGQLLDHLDDAQEIPLVFPVPANSPILRESSAAAVSALHAVNQKAIVDATIKKIMVVPGNILHLELEPIATRFDGGLIRKGDTIIVGSIELGRLKKTEGERIVYVATLEDI